MDKDEIIRLIREHYNILVAEYGICRIGIFGSAAKGTMTEHSDLDIVVEFSRPIGFKFISLVEYLEKIFGKKVDILTKDGVENIRVKEVARNIERDLIYV